MGHIRPCVLRSASALAVVLLIPTLNSNSATRSNTRSNAAIPTTARPAALPTPVADRRLAKAYGALPVSFEVNRGQTDASVQFLARGVGYTLFLTPHEAVLSVHRRDAKASMQGIPRGLPAARMPRERPNPMPSSATVRLSLLGSNPRAEVTGVDPLPGKSNYFLGSDPAKWHTEVSTFSKVRYHNIYPGVDLVYYGNQEGKLEHDFVIAPGANPNGIALVLKSSGNGTVQDENGNLRLHTSAGDLTLLKPTVYQNVGGKRKVIPANYELFAENKIRFHLGSYDKSAPLVIDPVLTHSGVFGGTSDDFVAAIAADDAGDAYVTGTTYSTDFPLANPEQSRWTSPDPARSTAMFVTKLNPAGTALVYSTYLGGPFSGGTGIAIDGSGRAYVAGYSSSGFPIKNAFQSVYGGGASDATFTILSAGGNSLVYSTYLGGPKDDFAEALTRDASGNIYITGIGGSGFPTLHSIKPAGSLGVFVAKFAATGTLQYSSIFANVQGLVTAIAADGSGSAYITGYTNAAGIPVTTGAYRTTCSFTTCGWAAKLNPSGASIAYSTYLGTSQAGGYGIAVDSSNSAYIAGATGDGFTTSSTAFKRTFGGGNVDGFVAKLNPTGSSLTWSTYLGGDGEDVIYGLALDQFRTVYVSGWTCSSNFPLKAAVQSYSRTTDRPCQLFVTTLDGSLNSIPYYSTYVGTATFSNQGSYIAVDKRSNVYLTGYDSGNVKPAGHGLATGVSTNPGGGFDVFVTKLDIVADLTLALSASPSPVHSGSNLTYTITVTNKGPDFATNVLVTDSVPPGATFVSVDSAGAPCRQPQVGGLGVINCFLPQLNKGATWTVKMTVKVNVAPGITLEDSAATNSNMQDFNINNGIASVDTLVQ